MHVYNSLTHNQTSAFFRLVTTIRQAKENSRKFTLFLGAGCSLSSSHEDISTSKIIERCLVDNLQGYKTPDSGEGLYRDFVNYIWTSFGEAERQEMLEKYFLNLTPSTGYKKLRKLVEHGFITDIVTTNFDMLINEALDGLGYTLYVADLPCRRLKGGSNITLYKIHGDIESGKLRFSPDELLDLPSNISKKIKEISGNSCAFCGYSGQDYGLMKSLETNSGYSVYWVSPKKPLKDDVYGTKYIYDWLSNRKSENNFIYGDDVGKFDTLMESLVNFLIEDKNVIGTFQWEKNTISEAIKINKNVFSIFKQLLQCSTNLRQQHEWKVKFPFFSKDYETTLNAYLYYYRDSKLPPSLLQIPENEIEALIMGMTIEILASTSGIDISIENYIDELKKTYEESNSKYFPDTSFWNALIAILLSIKNNTPIFNNEELLDVTLKMNSHGRVTFNVKEPRLNYVADVVSLLKISSLFIPTCENDSGIDKYGETKILLQKYGQADFVAENKLCFRLDKISRSELQNVFEVFFKNLKGYYFENNETIIGPKIKIIASIEEKPFVKPITSIPDYIYRLSTDSIIAFLKLKSAFEIDSTEYVPSFLDDALEEFIKSNKLGMFVIGSSGSGKTKGIQNFIEYYKNTEQFIAVASPKINSFDNMPSLSVFWKDLENFNNSEQILREINDVLSVRKTSLILIVDGLNEIDGGTDVCIQHYKSIIETLSELNSFGISTIKVIITCRDHAFLDYCEKTNLYPPMDICQCSVHKEHITPYFQILTLTLEQQLKFTKVYFNNSDKRKEFESDLENNHYIRQTFNQPYLIAVAGKYYCLHKKESDISTLQEMFKFYAEQMLKRLGNDLIINTARSIINIYLDLIIYSDRFGRRVTSYVLLDQILSKYNAEYLSEVLKQLCDINIFTDIHSGEYIKFTHDRIEEYFLCEYLYDKAGNSEVLIRFFKKVGSDPIFYSAGIEYFRKLTMRRSFQQIIDDYDVLYNYSSEELPCIIVNCLSILSEEDLKQLFITVNTSKIDMDNFILFLFSGLKQAIHRNDITFPERVISSFSTLTALFPLLSKYSKYFYYISSRYYLVQKDDIERAERYCDLSISEKTGDEYLGKLVDFQKAVVQKCRGQLDEAINTLTELYSYFSENEHWDSAAECVLEWGSTLREKTMFLEALEVYELINLQKLETSSVMQVKLHRKKGTIYKNIMQQMLNENSSGNGVKEGILAEIHQYYNNAINEYEEAKKKMIGAIDMIEKMTIISEQAEACMKIADIEQTQMYRAELFLNEHENYIASFPITDAKIVHLRLKSKYEEKMGNLQEAIKILENAREIAVGGSKSFRVFEVDYQLGRLIERYKDKLLPEELNKGVDALNKAINMDLARDNKYILNCMNSKDRLEAYISMNK